MNVDRDASSMVIRAQDVNRQPLAGFRTLRENR